MCIRDRTYTVRMAISLGALDRRGSTKPPHFHTAPVDAAGIGARGLSAFRTGLACDSRLMRRSRRASARPTSRVRQSPSWRPRVALEREPGRGTGEKYIVLQPTQATTSVTMAGCG